MHLHGISLDVDGQIVSLVTHKGHHEIWLTDPSTGRAVCRHATTAFGSSIFTDRGVAQIEAAIDRARVGRPPTGPLPDDITSDQLVARALAHLDDTIARLRPHLARRSGVAR